MKLSESLALDVLDFLKMRVCQIILSQMSVPKWFRQSVNAYPSIIMQNIQRLPSLIGCALMYLSVWQFPANAEEPSAIQFRFEPMPIPAGSTFFVGTAANKSGWIVGYNGNGAGELAGSLLKGSTVSDVGLPSTLTRSIQSNFPFGITKEGVVVGMAYDYSGPGYAYTRKGSATDVLNYPGSEQGWTAVRAVSSDGKILGDAGINVEPYYLDFIYKDGVFTPLSLPPNSPYSFIYWYSINKHGTLLGLGYDNNGQPSLVTANGSGYEVLPALPDNFQATPVAILDSGDIVCNGYDLSVYDPNLGYGNAGLILHEGVWTKIRHPSDNLGHTRVTGAGDHSSNGATVLGDYWSAEQQKYVPFIAKDEGFNRD